MNNLRMVTGSRAASESVGWIGAEAGIFRKHGLDVKFPSLEVGGPQAATGLARGDWDFIQTGTVPIAEAVLNGGDPVILLRNHTPTASHVILARQDICDLSALTGKVVGVLTDTHSGQAGVIARSTIEKAGAVAKYQGLGTYRNIFNALGASAIDAGILPLDYRFIGTSKYGLNVFDTPVSTLPTIFATTRRLIATDRDLVVRSVRALVESIHLFKTSKITVLPLLQRFLNFDDIGAVDDVWNYYVPLLQAAPRPSLAEAVTDVRGLFAKRYAMAQNLNEADIVDQSIIDEVERSGFIKQLYGASNAS